MLQEMKEFNKCLFKCGHIKEDKAVPWRIRKNIQGSREELKWVEALVNRRAEERGWRGDCNPF